MLSKPLKRSKLNLNQRITLLQLETSITCNQNSFVTIPNMVRSCTMTRLSRRAARLELLLPFVINVSRIKHWGWAIWALQIDSQRFSNDLVIIWKKNEKSFFEKRKIGKKNEKSFFEKTKNRKIKTKNRFLKNEKKKVCSQLSFLVFFW